MGDQELNLKLVNEVEKHEELYNYKLPAYSRKDLTEKAWQDVASQVNMPGMKTSVIYYYLKCIVFVFCKRRENLH